MQEPIICEDCGTKVTAGAATCPNCGLDFASQGAWESRVEESIGGAFPLPPEEALHGKPEGSSSRAGRVQPASFGSRLAAYFVDYILVTVLSYGAAAVVAVGMFAMSDSGVDSWEDEPPLPFLIAILASSFTIPFLYFTLMECSSLQATLGKKLVGIRVTDLSGQRITFGRAATRFLGKILSALILMIGFLMAAFTERKQALHDIMASTLVVRD